MSTNGRNRSGRSSKATPAVKGDRAGPSRSCISPGSMDPTTREQSDFLATENHAGESLDFHSHLYSGAKYTPKAIVR
jgi:hypothetical protein